MACDESGAASAGWLSRSVGAESVIDYRTAIMRQPFSWQERRKRRSQVNGQRNIQALSLRFRFSLLTRSWGRIRGGLYHQI